MIQRIKNLLKKDKQPDDFISVADVANQRGCDCRTVMALAVRGILPPLLGNQCGLGPKQKGWTRTYWTEWFKQQARNQDVDVGRQLAVP